MTGGAVAVVAALGALLLALAAVSAPALASMRAMWDATPARRPSRSPPGWC